ncbi:hypothetical protein D3C77_621850 [compost metagenome]
MQQVSGVRLGLELGDDVLDVLSVILVGNQHGIGGVDDQQVFDADQCGQATFAVDVVIA